MRGPSRSSCAQTTVRTAAAEKTKAAEITYLDPVDLGIDGLFLRRLSLIAQIDVGPNDGQDVRVGGTFLDELPVLLEGALLLPELVDAGVVEPTVQSRQILQGAGGEFEVGGTVWLLSQVRKEAAVEHAGRARFRRSEGVDERRGSSGSRRRGDIREGKPGRVVGLRHVRSVVVELEERRPRDGVPRRGLRGTCDPEPGQPLGPAVSHEIVHLK